MQLINVLNTTNEKIFLNLLNDIYTLELIKKFKFKKKNFQNFTQEITVQQWGL